MDVEVCTGVPARQPTAVGGGERQRHHVLVVRDHPPVHHRQRNGAVRFGGRLHLPDGARDRPQSCDGGVDNTQRNIVANPTRNAGRRLAVAVEQSHQIWAARAAGELAR